MFNISLLSSYSVIYLLVFHFANQNRVFNLKNLDYLHRKKRSQGAMDGPAGSGFFVVKMGEGGDQRGHHSNSVGSMMI